MGETYINSINLNAGTDFPYLFLNIINEHSYPLNPGFQVMHWHEDLQFIYLFEGTIEVRTLTDSVILRGGEGIFINQNVVHLVKHHGPCHYNSFVFPAYFLKFYDGCPAGKLVDRIIGSERLSIYRLARGIGWCETVLSGLMALSQLENCKTEYYAYEVLVRLSTIWLEVCKNILLPSERQKDTVSERMQAFLHFIEYHYGEEISLDTLSRSANVSKSECLRCFQLSMQTTPYKYLIEYRLSKAAELLKSSNAPVGEIASSVGFHQASHFGKCFKEKTGYSPKEYRAKN